MNIEANRLRLEINGLDAGILTSLAFQHGQAFIYATRMHPAGPPPVELVGTEVDATITGAHVRLRGRALVTKIDLESFEWHTTLVSRAPLERENRDEPPADLPSGPTWQDLPDGTTDIREAFTAELRRMAEPWERAVHDNGDYRV